MGPLEITPCKHRLYESNTSTFVETPNLLPELKGHSRCMLVDEFPPNVSITCYQDMVDGRASVNPSDFEVGTQLVFMDSIDHSIGYAD